MKGIILAGGKGTRLYPITLSISKQLLPVYDKPMIYYPLSVLMSIGIREILIISTSHDLPRFKQLLQDGSQLGLSLSYAEQNEPLGIAHSFLVGESFIARESVALILGDNIFYGHQLEQMLAPFLHLKKGAAIFGYEVNDPTRYGVVKLDKEKKVIEIVEKPKRAPSPYAVTGLYFYDQDVVDIVKNLDFSPRGELEITDVNRAYLARGDLQFHLFQRGFAWLDTGTYEALQMASSYVQTIQERQGIKIACLEEIAYKKGYIDEEQLLKLAANFSSCEYGQYLQRVASSTHSMQELDFTLV
jgi:glucose-1-phosphate thymidylyltransferase